MFCNDICMLQVLLLSTLRSTVGNTFTAKEILNKKSCHSENHFFKGYTFRTESVPNFLRCEKLCRYHAKCESINYHFGSQTCHMNSETVEADSKRLIYTKGWTYCDSASFRQLVPGEICNPNPCKENEICSPSAIGKYRCLPLDISCGDLHGIEGVKDVQLIGSTYGSKAFFTCDTLHVNTSPAFTCGFDGRWGPPGTGCKFYCPSNYSHNMKTSFCFKMYNSLATWQSADQKCSTDGGHLVNIYSQERQNSLNQKWDEKITEGMNHQSSFCTDEKYNVNFSILGMNLHSSFYTGGKYNVTLQRFQWTNGEPIPLYTPTEAYTNGSFKNWLRTEKTTPAGSGCLVLDRSDEQDSYLAHSFGWWNRSCEKERHFICEVDVP